MQPLEFTAACPNISQHKSWRCKINFVVNVERQPSFVITRRCLYGSAPRYLAACFVPVSTTASRQHLRSAAGHQLVIPSHRFTTYGRRAFSVAGRMFWNSLPRNLRDQSHSTAAVFGRSQKTFILSEYQCIRGIGDDALYKLMFYLLTYML